jgi:hypothetical protein
LQKLYETKEKIKSELLTLDENLELLRKEFKPSQSAKLVMNIERNQYSD